jgi:transposase
LNGIEFLQFIYGGGTKNETFRDFFKALVKKMKKKYPRKRIVYLLDNLWAHKSSLIIDIARRKKAHLLFTPSNTPE